MSTELFADYIKETRNEHIVQNDRGFITYSLHPEAKEIMVQDFYVKPEHRRTRTALSLAEEVVKIGRDKGMQFLTAINHVDPNDTSKATYIAKLHLHWGMKIFKVIDKQIIMYKEIGDEELVPSKSKEKEN